MRRLVRVLADDLTGALDTAACFALPGIGWPVNVTWDSPDPNTFALSTDTRDRDVAVASRVAAACAAWLTEAKHPFKKVDSRLRGHVAAELSAILRIAGPIRVVVAPALPGQGRIVRGGCVHARDKDGGSWRREPVDLAAELRAGGIAVALARPGAVAPTGLSLWDAETDQDLDCIVEAGLHAGQPTLWCGSAGLGEALARALGCWKVPEFAARRPALVLIGTRHARTLDQLAFVGRAVPDALAEIAPDGLGADAIARALAAGRSRIVRVKLPENVTAEDAASWIEGGFSALLAEVPRPALLAATGGATLQAALRHLEASGIAVEGTLAPGIPGGHLLGGRWHGLPLIAKSGGFGAPEALLQMLGETD